MSRGGRGGRGGRGFGRGGFGGGNISMLAMGVTWTDIESASGQSTPLYPPLNPMPVLSDITEEERRICELQMGFAKRLRKSAYYVVEPTKSTDLPRYSDKYRPSSASQPTLKRKDLHQPFFPPDVFESYFNPRTRKVIKKTAAKRINLDEVTDGAEEQDKSSDERSDVGSQAAASDYDVEEEYDNDYAENYFDNGENDDLDDLGATGGDEGGADWE